MTRPAVLLPHALPHPLPHRCARPPLPRILVRLGTAAALALLPLSVSGQDPAQGQEPVGGGAPDGRALPVREHVLENGMHFFFLPREGAPTISFVTHVAVGSVHESLGSTGTAHFLEHLLFKGTTTIGTLDVEAERRLFAAMDAAHDSLLQARGRRADGVEEEVERLEGRIRVLEDSARALVVPNELDQIASRNGARGLNATTGYEATQYFVNFPANRARLWFLLEADRLRNPVFREFYAERDVVAEERRARTDTSPGGILYEEHLAAAFRAHPYGVPPVGHMDDILALSRPEVEAFHARHYGARNLRVAVVGDFDADSAVVWAERYFGPLEAGEPPPPLLVREPEQRGERRLEVRFDAEPQLRIGWKIPSVLHPDAPALNVLANLLVGGRDSRLYRRLVRDERIATSVTASTGPGNLYPGLFTIHAVTLDPGTPAEVEAAIYEEIERLRVEPPSEAEMTRVRTRLEADGVRRLTSNQGLAFQLLTSHAIWGDWRETFHAQDRMRAVEVEDVLAVLERYFLPDRRTVAILRRPEGS